VAESEGFELIAYAIALTQENKFLPRNYHKLYHKLGKVGTHSYQ